MSLKVEPCKFLVILTLFLHLSGKCSGQLCNGNVGEYFPHDNDCTKFYQCAADGQAVTMQCPSGLYWDQSKTTCNYRDQVNCTNDQCQTSSVFKISCREYYPCDVRAGDSYCCPYGQSINVNTGKCEKDKSCTVPCNECQEILFIDFNGPEVRDTMGNYVENSGVTTVNGKGYFDGNSSLTIPYFNNVPLAPYFRVSMRYKAASGIIVGKQALLTNGDCEVSGQGSVEITIEERKTNFVMRNDNGGETRIKRNTSKQRSFNRLVYQYGDGKFRAQLSRANKPNKTKQSNGAIGKSNCDLKIGRGNSFDNFRGHIGFIKIWRCNRY